MLGQLPVAMHRCQMNMTTRSCIDFLTRAEIVGKQICNAKSITLFVADSVYQSMWCTSKIRGCAWDSSVT